MKTVTTTAALLSVLILALPMAASAQRGYRPLDDKAFAFRAGFDDGFRQGLRDGRMDHRAGFRFNYRGRDRVRTFERHAFGFRREGDYRKGFRDGYRRGYQSGYRRFADRRIPGRW